MGLGFTETQNITLEKIENISSVSSYSELVINVNQEIYGGVFYFLILVTLFVILYISFQKVDDYPMVNFMYAANIVGILSIILRLIYIVQDGIAVGLITDPLTWVFPIVAVIMAFIVKSGDS